MKGHRTFIDTNVLLYAIDDKYPEKHRIAREALAPIIKERNGVISIQVANEFASNLVRKFGLTLPEVEIACIGLQEFKFQRSRLELVFVSVGIMSEASVSFWDAAIIASAVESGCDTLLTEDLNHGQVIAGVRIVNPFA